MSVNYQPYRPAPLRGELAAAVTAVSRSFGPRRIIGGQTGALTLDFMAVPERGAWPPVGRLSLEAGGFQWSLCLGSWDLLAFDDALRRVEPESLPEEFKLAGAALVLKPALAALERALETPVTVSGPGRLDDAEHDGLEFGLGLKAEDGLSAYVPLMIRPHDARAYGWLTDTLARWPGRGRFRVDGLRLPVSIVAAEMRAPLKVVGNLEVGDILLPPAYPAAEGRLFLKIQGQPGIPLIWADGFARVAPPMPDDKEMLVPADANEFEGRENAAEVPDGDAVRAIKDVEDLEVAVGFELGRLNMSVGDLSALTVGAVFPLGVDPAAPVTLTVNNQPIARGRLVDLDGVPGVQVTRVSK